MNTLYYIKHPLCCHEEESTCLVQKRNRRGRTSSPNTSNLNPGVTPRAHSSSDLHHRTALAPPNSKTSATKAAVVREPFPTSNEKHPSVFNFSPSAEFAARLLRSPPVLLLLRRSFNRNNPPPTRTTITWQIVLRPPQSPPPSPSLRPCPPLHPATLLPTWR